MGKKVKKKPKSGKKDERVITPSPKITSKECSDNGETPGNDGVLVVKERGACPHIEKWIKLEKLAAKLESSDCHKCEDCRDNAMDRRANKGKSKHVKKGAMKSKSELKAIWICLECGHFSCGGVGLPTTPQSHAVRHAKQNHHPLAIHFENSQLIWCFPCNNLVTSRIQEDKNEHKGAIHEVAKMLKERPRQGSPVNLESLQLGRGSETSAVESDHSASVGEDERASYSVRGLINLGNTCFFNSTMQNLLALNKFRDNVLKLDESVGPLSASLRKLFLETATNSGLRSAINPRSLFSSLCIKNPQFRGYQQHDSHELLRCFLDSLSTEELIARKQVKSSSAEENASVTQPTIVDEIFGGQLSSTVSCLECGYSSAIYEPFLDLSLPIPSKTHPSKLTQPNTRGKKPKIPPKRMGKISSKGSRDRCVLPAGSVSDQSTVGNSFSQMQTRFQSSEQLVISSGDLNSAVIDMGFTPQNLLDIQQPKIHQLVDNGGDHSFSSDILTWLDYIEPTQSSNGVDDDASETHETSENQASANDNASQSDATLHIKMVPDIGNNSAHSISETYLDSASEFNSTEQCVLAAQSNAFSDFEDHQISTSRHDENVSSNESLTKEVIQPGTDLVNSSGLSNHVCYCDSNIDVCSSGRDIEHPSLLQSSDILLLPYIEDVPSSVDLVRGETEASTSVIGDELGSSEFDGFGDLFNEPEASSELGPSVHVSDASGTMKTGIVVNSSDSDPGEVDNTGTPVSVESCLAFFTKPELLSKDEHSWLCENCSKILREKSVTSMSKPVNEIVPNDCNNTKEHSLLNAGKQFRGAKINGNAEDLFDVLSDRSMTHKEIDDNCKSILRNLADAETNVIRCQTRNIMTMTLDSCHGQLGFPSFSGQNFDSCISKCGTESVGLSEVNSLPAKLESEVSEKEDVERKRVNVFRDATKSILVSKAPPILTIHLKRFSQDARGCLSKLNGHVNFRETIDFKPYMNPSRCIDKEKYAYRLVGAVEHSGSMRGGHYVAYVRGSGCNGYSVWYHANDAHVREASLDEVLRCEAYILFYEKSQ